MAEKLNASYYLLIVAILFLTSLCSLLSFD